MKTCSKCGQTKGRTSFNFKKASPDGLRPECQACQKRDSVVYIARIGKDEIARRARVAHKARRFDLTMDEYIALLNSQEGCCAICRDELNPEGQGTHIDHMQLSTEKGRSYSKRVDGPVRGILCRECNIALGLFKHDPVVLKSATEYLERAAIRYLERNKT